jgi:hypothetical protein
MRTGTQLARKSEVDTILTYGSARLKSTLAGAYDIRTNTGSKEANSTPSA